MLSFSCPSPPTPSILSVDSVDLQTPGKSTQLIPGETSPVVASEVSDDDPLDSWARFEPATLGQKSDAQDGKEHGDIQVVRIIARTNVVGTNSFELDIEDLRSDL